jgi:phosphatidylglycerol lysyltransferase
MFIPIRQLWWLAAGSGASYTARYMKARIGFALAERRRKKLPDPTGELLRLQMLYGFNAHSLVSIAPGAEMWSTPDIDGAIIYSEFGRVWLAAGDPLATQDESAELARQFAAFAKRRNRVVAFVPTSSQFARQVVPSDFSAVKCGAAPYFDLQTWNPRGDSAKKLRAGVNQARRAGVEIELATDLNKTFKSETADVCMRWLGARPAATTFGWLVALDPFMHAEYKRYFAARVGGKLVGVLAASPIPARKGWYLEDVINEPNAPQGTATLLVVEALKHLKAEGAALATLGTAPLATDGPNDIPTEHRVVARTLDMASRNLGSFYNFEGLRRFKGKFVPSWWESEYALSQRGVAMPPRVGHAIVRAIVPGGLTQLFTRHAIRAMHGNSLAVKRAVTKRVSHASSYVAKNVTKSLKPSSKSPSRK